MADLTQRNKDIEEFWKSGMTLLDIAHAFELPVQRVFSLLVHRLDISLADIKQDRAKVKESERGRQE